MESAFKRCTNLTSIDLSNFKFNNPNVSFNYIFLECINLKYIDISNFDFLSNTTYTLFDSDLPLEGTIIVKDENAKNKIKGQVKQWEIKYKK